MPTISMFYGILVFMYALDTQKHHLPHIHLQYAEISAVVQIPNGELLGGELPVKQMKLVQAWIAFMLKNLWPTGRLQQQAPHLTKLTH